MGVRLPHFWLIVKLLLSLMVSALALTLLCSFLVGRTADNALYSNLDALPYKQVGIVLGTSKYSRQGGLNDHYRLRVNAAIELFKAGKIDYILISGDNSTPFYDEPTTIRRDLLKSGIPAQNIYRDYAGFRTLDSILRAHHVFELDSFTIISQAPHSKRALYIAIHHDIDAVAFNAGDGHNSDISNKIREMLARVLAVMEVHFFNTGPKFLGPTIQIGVAPPT